MDQKTARVALVNSKYKTTRTRTLILRTIFKIEGPFSAEDILATITQNPKSRNIDMATIYRNLPIFEEIGLICRGEFSDRKALYVLAQTIQKHHQHKVVCRSCHRVTTVDVCGLKAQEKILTKLGFRNVSHRLEFSGICKSCFALNSNLKA